jgi:serine/threonine protein kinase
MQPQPKSPLIQMPQLSQAQLILGSSSAARATAPTAAAAGTTITASPSTTSANSTARSAAPNAPNRIVLRLARGIASGLATLHAHGAAHGGLTPTNVLLEPARVHGSGNDMGSSSGSRDGQQKGGKRQKGVCAGCVMRITPHGTCGCVNAKISDWGAWAMCSSPSSREGASSWSRQILSRSSDHWRYAAPELLCGTTHPNAVTDAYSFGAVLYHMLTGHAPHAVATSAAPSQLEARSVAQMAEAGHALELKWPETIWEPVRVLGEQCTSLSPSDRPSMETVAKQLNRWGKEQLLDKQVMAAVAAAAAAAAVRMPPSAASRHGKYGHLRGGAGGGPAGLPNLRAAAGGMRALKLPASSLEQNADSRTHTR